MKEEQVWDWTWPEFFSRHFVVKMTPKHRCKVGSLIHESGLPKI